MLSAAIIGASGYTGAQAIEIFMRHSQAKLTYLTALPEECGKVADVFPRFRGRCGLEIEPLNRTNSSTVQRLCFAAFRIKFRWDLCRIF
jgi:N-acetyl-gamma-glutamyl-phosphate reductase